MERSAQSTGYGPIFEAAHDAIFVLEAPSGRILDVNRRVTELYGWSKEEARQLTIVQLSEGNPPFGEAEASEWVRRAADEPQLFEWLSKHRSGRLFWSEVSIERVSLEGEDRFVAIVRDVSARKNAEQALRASEQRFRATFDQAAVGMLHVSLDGRYLRVNRRLCETLGYSAEELLTLPRETFSLPEDVDADNAAARELIEGELERFAREKRYRRKDGSFIWCLLTVSLVRDEAGSPQYFVAVLEDISERKRTEEELRLGEERLRALFEQMVAGFAVLELVYDDAGVPIDYRFLDVNPAFERITGFPRERALGRRFQEVQPGPAPWWFPTFVEVERTGQAAHVAGFDPALGRYFELTAYRTEAGRLAMTFNDTTERLLAERARERLLREVDSQRALLEAVVANTPNVIALLRGPRLVIELANPALLRQSHYPLVGKTLLEVGDRAAPELVPHASEVLRTGTPATISDLPVVGPDGERGYFSFTMVRLPPDESEEPAVLLVGNDTTERVRARLRIEELAAAAQQKAAQLQSVIDNMVEGVFVFDTAGSLVLANDSGVRLLDLPSEQVRGVSRNDWARLLSSNRGEPLSPERLALTRALQGETVSQQAERLVFADRHARHIQVSAAPIHDAQGAVVGAVEVVRDVTELVELDRLKDEFILVAAHELKTPVAIMKGYAQSLSRLPEGAAAPRRMLQAIDRGADRIDALVRALLDISQLFLGKLSLSFERIDLAELVAELCERKSVETGRRIEVAELAPAVVEGDRDRLAQVLGVLLDNALLYSPSGEQVDVKLTLDGSEAVVSVRDHGVGIPRERQPRIFERFYRAHTGTPHDYGGMGVGLYIAREIVTRHRGRIWFESEPGRGSTFSFALPLPALPSARTAAGEAFEADE